MNKTRSVATPALSMESAPVEGKAPAPLAFLPQGSFLFQRLLPLKQQAATAASIGFSPKINATAASCLVAKFLTTACSCLSCRQPETAKRSQGIADARQPTFYKAHSHARQCLSYSLGHLLAALHRCPVREGGYRPRSTPRWPAAHLGLASWRVRVWRRSPCTR